MHRAKRPRADALPQPSVQLLGEDSRPAERKAGVRVPLQQLTNAQRQPAVRQPRKLQGFRQDQQPPPAQRNTQQQQQRPCAPALPPPDWPPESPPVPKRASEDATSGCAVGRTAKGHAKQPIGQDVAEAASSGTRITSSLESLLFCPWSTTVNPALATRNRKVETDLNEPAEGVRIAVASLESLRAQLAKLPSSYLRLGLMQETITCLFGSCVFDAGTMQGLLQQRKANIVLPAESEQTAQAMQAMQAAAAAIDSALSSIKSKEERAEACYEVMQRFCVRLALPWDPFGGAHTFALWIEQAVATWAPRLVMPAEGSAEPAADPRRVIADVMELLNTVAECVEDSCHGKGEDYRNMLSSAILRDMAQRALDSGRRRIPLAAPPPERTALLLTVLGPAAPPSLLKSVGQACSLMSQLAVHSRRLAAVVEVTERACRVMRTPWAPVMQLITCYT